jgi:hypothetical protein
MDKKKIGQEILAELYVMRDKMSDLVEKSKGLGLINEYSLEVALEETEETLTRNIRSTKEILFNIQLNLNCPID